MATNRIQFLRKHGIPTSQSLSLPEIAKLAKMPLAALEEVEKRGAGAWQTNPQSVRIAGTFIKDSDMKSFPRSKRLTQEQWARARSYAFANKSKKVFYGSDKDIAAKYNIK